MISKCEKIVDHKTIQNVNYYKIVQIYKNNKVESWKPQYSMSQYQHMIEEYHIELLTKENTETKPPTPPNETTKPPEVIEIGESSEQLYQRRTRKIKKQKYANTSLPRKITPKKPTPKSKPVSQKFQNTETQNMQQQRQDIEPQKQDTKQKQEESKKSATISSIAVKKGSKRLTVDKSSIQSVETQMKKDQSKVLSQSESVLSDCSPIAKRIQRRSPQKLIQDKSQMFFKIIGMDISDKMYRFLIQMMDGCKHWLDHDEVIDKYPKQLISFYESKIEINHQRPDYKKMFNRDQDI